MKCVETESIGLSTTETKISNRSHGGANYTRARDDRKRPIRGLWVRNGRFYAQLTILDGDTGLKKVKRVPFVGDTAAAAKKEMDKLKVKREENSLPVLGRTPKFSDYAASYFAHFEQLKDAKRASTLAKERGTVDRWKEHLGHVRLNHITKAQINSFLAKRQSDGMSARTVNLDVIVLRNVLKRAIDDGHLKALPTANMRPLKTATPRRRLFALNEIESVCAKALEVSKNGSEFGNYVRLMAFCGSRRDETLRLRWSDVDWEQRQLVIGSDGLAKNRKAREVDFNADLEAHLKSMHTRRAPDSEFLFPSPQRGDKDRHAKTFKETLNAAREKAGVPDFNFHDCRHFFISTCVMAGVDFMTIAKWVGHQDGGVLVGKVYGHLADEHRKRQAQKVAFGVKLVA